MTPFFTKYARHFTEKDAIELIYHKIKDAKNYSAEEKKFEAVKELKEASEMLSDLIGHYAG